MKRIATTFVLVVVLWVGGCRTTSRTHTVGCATCIFDMPEVSGCQLAVKVDGVPYLVDGSGIDDHGDAHAADGLCNSERQAIVKGSIRNDRFAAQHIEVLEDENR